MTRGPPSEGPPPLEAQETLPAPPPVPEGDDLQAGARIGRFLVLERLGAGGMGIVLGAFDHDLDRRVALKLLRSASWGGGAASEARERLLREARAMARLEHENVIAVHEVGTFHDQVYVAMEYVDGRTLGAWRSEAPRSWREVLAMYVPAGRGLQAAHAAGMVHRDFKPDNVLCGKDGRIRVTDFGLVGTAGAQAEADGGIPAGALLDTTLTHTGALLGTPSYMAPEQHARQPADARADQFAFCVSLWEAVYGTRPFAGPGYAELADNVRAGRVSAPPPGSDVPAWLRAALTRGLSVRPEDRFPSMAALLDVLEHDPEARRRRHLRRWGIAAALAVSAGAIGFVLARQVEPAPVALCQGAADRLGQVWNDERRAAIHTAFAATRLPYAEAAFERVAQRLHSYGAVWSSARTEACEATRVRGDQSEALLDLRIACLDRRLAELDTLAGLLAKGPDPGVVEKSVEASANLTGVEGCADVTALSAAFPPPEDVRARATVAALDARLAEVNQLEQLGKYAAALAAAEAVREEAAPVDHPPLRAAALLRLASIRRRMGDLAGAETLLYEAARAAAQARSDGMTADIWILLIELRVAQGRLDDVDTLERVAEAAVVRTGSETFEAHLWSSIGHARYARSRFEDARVSYARALAIWERTVAEDDPRRTMGLVNLGRAIDALGRYDEARALYERGVAGIERTHGPDHPFMGVCLTNLGGVLHAQGKLPEARKVFERALAVDEGALAADHPHIAMSLRNLAGVMREQGDLAAARPLLERALAIVEKALGPDHPMAADVLNGLGTLHMAMADDQAARPYLLRALAIREKALGPDHPDVAMTLANLGNIEFHARRWAEARGYYQRAAGIVERALGPDHPELSAYLTSLGSALEHEGKLAEARKLYERALAIDEKSLGPDHPELAWSLVGLGELLARERRYDQALVHLERALALREAHPGDPSDLAATRFTLAEVLWTANRDRPRALRLARLALDWFATAGAAREPERALIDGWLRARGG